ncbi:MAG: beta-ketoacyl-ACP synthase III [Pseudomonadota bacterium]|nr:beta-ketoacyl-ACP synthase III [Pseudomonadota bacterium]
MRGSRIAGMGHYVPERVVTNDDMKQWMDTSDEWIHQRTGIRERRWVEGNVGAAELGEHAARGALAEAGLEAKDLDLILFATLSPDINFPGSSCLLQARLGVPGIATLDIRNQCTGFLYGLATADAYIRSGMMKNVLVVGGEVHSSGLDLSTRGRDVTVLFGDGAGAAVVSATDGDRRIIDSELHADGRYAEILMLEAPASRNQPRLTEEMIARGAHFPKMDGKSVFKHAVERIPEVTRSILARNDLKLDDIALLVPHQANMRINEMVTRQLGFPPEKVVHNIQKYGNTTAASIPIALHEAAQEGRIKEGELALLVAFGAGLTWGATLVRW